MYREEELNNSGNNEFQIHETESNKENVELEVNTQNLEDKENINEDLEDKENINEDLEDKENINEEKIISDAKAVINRNMENNASNGYYNRIDNKGDFYRENSYIHNKNNMKKKNGCLNILLIGVIAVIFLCILFVVGTIGFKSLRNYLNGNTEKYNIITSTDTNNSGYTSSDEETLESMVEEVMPSVVSITTMSVQQVRGFFGGVESYETSGAGSGVIIGKNENELLIVTNNHVIEGATSITVTFINEESIEGEVKGTNANKDIAIVSVPLSSIGDETVSEIKQATLGDSDNIKVGQSAVAIGNALGYGQSVTEGIISATKRTIEDYDGNLLQTDAAINPGNSGGALLNSKGELIGINTIKYASTDVEGMGYAIPINDVKEIVENLITKASKETYGEDERGYLGISCTDISSELSEIYNMPVGVYVSKVSNSNKTVELQKGDIIVGIEGETIKTTDTLQEELKYYKAGETITLTINRSSNGGEYEEMEVKVELTKKSNME